MTKKTYIKKAAKEYKRLSLGRCKHDWVWVSGMAGIGLTTHWCKVCGTLRERNNTFSSYRYFYPEGNK